MPVEVDVKGLHFVSRPGPKARRWYVYAWRGGPCIYKTTGPTKPALPPHIIASLTGLQAEAHKPRPGTFARLVHDYRASPIGWQRLSPNTRRVWAPHIDSAETRWQHVPLSIWSNPRMRAKIALWRDESAATPRTADIRISALVHMLGWAVDQGLVLINAAKGLAKLDAGADRAEIIWSAADVAAILAVAPPQVQDIVDLARLTGFRRADLARVGWGHVGEFSIIITAAKTSRGKRYRVSRAITPSLRTLLERLKSRARKPGVTTLLVNSRGLAWTDSGLENSFRATAALAYGGKGIWHHPAPEESSAGSGRPKPARLHLHDFRGTYATHLMANLPDLTDRQIADMMGWSAENIARIRTRYVEQSTVTTALGKRLATAGL